MAHIDTEIADLESILTNLTENHSQEEIKKMEQELKRYTLIKDLWTEFGTIPMNPKTECLELPFIPKKHRRKDHNNVSCGYTQRGNMALVRRIFQLVRSGRSDVPITEMQKGDRIHE